MWIVYKIVKLFFDLLSLAILARVFLSWFNLSPYHPIMSFLIQITEPVLAPLRRVIPPIGMIDITPVVAIILLQMMEGIILAILSGIFW
ncbi:MAG: YggT family protein [Chloroflexi bacterium]|nr:MAG: YggT family protein [Chloroflexota bacterium]HDN79815.1 YggT family protein [Chloroflexota bacterium]